MGIEYIIPSHFGMCSRVIKDKAMDFQKKAIVSPLLGLMTSCVTNKSFMELISSPTDRISHHTPHT